MNKNNSILKNQIKKPIFGIFVLLLLYMFIGFIVIPFIVRGQIIDFIQNEYGRKARIESVSFNPFNFTLSVDGFLMNEKDSGIFLKWGHFLVNLNFFPLFKKEIDIEELKFLNPDITLIKKRDEFNFSDLIPSEEEHDTSEGELNWNVYIRKLEIQKLNIFFQDQSVEHFAEVHLDSIDLTANNIHLSSTDTTKFEVSFKIREGGYGSAQGIFTQIPMLSEFSFDIDSISILPSQPYFSKFAYLRIDQGKINAEGSVNFNVPNDTTANILFSGTVGMNQLNLFDTQKEEKFLSWNRLENFGMIINSQPLSLNIDSVVIDGLYSRIGVAEDQTINLIDAFEPMLKDTDTTYAKDTTANYNFDLGTIDISNSEMFFSDFSLPINFAVRIHSLNGKIAGISAGNPLGAIIILEGAVDEYGYTKIEGNMDPFSPLNYTDITMNFHNIDLNAMDGYSAKFVGYELDNGKLSLDLEYLIKNGILTSSNQIIFNKLALGDEVENEEENLGPLVKLAIALLQDSEGNIDLDIEVEGDLNDPEVSTGKLVWWAVKRSLTTIVTAPFRFLGNLLGISNGDELEYVDFKVADTALAAHQIEKLINMSKALNKRPGLSLGIFGAVDTVADKYALQKIKFDSLFTLRLRESTGEKDIKTVDANQELRREILETMYVESFNDSLLNDLLSHHVDQKDNNISAANIEIDDIKNLRDYFNELTENIILKIKISKAVMLKLASERAEKIEFFLISKQKLPADRISIKGTEIYEYEDDNWVKCRLELGAL